MKEVLNYISDNQKNFIEDLKNLLRTPSVSTDPKHHGDILKCAEQVKTLFKKAGMKTVEILETKGNPVVYAEWLEAKGQPTLLIYGHYDVQPEDPIDEWKTPPFEPTIIGHEIFARGAADSKGQFLVHIKGVEAFLKKWGKLPINVKFIIEGEEEVGSKNLFQFLEENKEKLASDAVIVADTIMSKKDWPTIVYRLRGGVFLELEVKGPKTDLHSGEFGGMVVNPANALTKILSQLVDTQGKIKVPHFYDDVIEPTAFDKETITVSPIENKQGLEKIWLFPSFDINGLTSGYSGKGVKGVIPAKATAKFSMRLVPNQNPDKIIKELENYIQKIKPAGVDVSIRVDHGTWPVIADMDNPSLGATKRALKNAFGREPIYAGGGGGLPVVTAFKKHLGLDSILTGICLPDGNIHAPNEKLDLDQFEKGVKFAAHFLKELII